jgi:hypothetical protein
MPSAFTVTNSPLTTSGTINVTGAGTTLQYVRGDGSLATFPTITNGTVTSVNLTSGTGISVSGGPITTSGSINVVNTAPDQVVSLTGSGTTTITGTYPNFTISSADSNVGTVTSVNMTVPTGLTISGNPITSAGTLALALASGYSIPTTANQANWTTAYNDSITSASVSGTSTKTLTLNQQDGGTVTASWSDTDTGLTSVGLSMPSAFAVSNSPLTSNGTLAVTGAGTASQYVRGDGQLADFPTTSGGGASVSYYLNGSVNQGTLGGNVYYELNKTPIFGAGTDFTINADGYIAQFITDANDPDLLKIPGGNWNFELYFSSSSSGGTPQFYAELSKYNGTTFTLIASGSTNPEFISFGTSISSYHTTLAVPETVLLATDRLAVRIYVIHSGRTIKLHTEGNHLSEIVTTFSTGLNALNGLTDQVQYFATGSSGTDFAISSATDTHTFNLPIASATNTGKLSNSDWTTFINKQSAITLTTFNASGSATFVSSVLNIPTYTLVGLGGEPAITAGATTQYFRGDKTFVTLDTSVVPENSNLYFTDTRARNAITLTTTGSSGASTYSGGTLNVPTYTLAGLGGQPQLNGTGFVVASGTTITYDNNTYYLASNPNAYITLGSISESATGLEYNNTTGVFSLTSGYVIPTTSSATNWDAAYNDKINSAAVTGTTTKTLTLTQQDGGTITASWTDDNTDAVASVFGRTGAVIATSGDYTTAQVTESGNLYYTDTRARAAITLTTTGSSGAATYSGGTLNIPTYSVAGLGAVPDSRTITINGVVFDLSANRNFEIGDYGSF